MHSASLFPSIMCLAPHILSVIVPFRVSAQTLTEPASSTAIRAPKIFRVISHPPQFFLALVLPLSHGEKLRRLFLWVSVSLWQRISEKYHGIGIRAGRR